MKTITMKFGGTSVGGPEAISGVVNIIRDDLERGNRVVAVVSAMSGVTDALIGSVREAIGGNKWGYLSCSQKLQDRHEEAINQLVAPGPARDSVHVEVKTLLAQHVELCEAISVLGEAT